LLFFTLPEAPSLEKEIFLCNSGLEEEEDSVSFGRFATAAKNKGV